MKLKCGLYFEQTIIQQVDLFTILYLILVSYKFH